MWMGRGRCRLDRLPWGGEQLIWKMWLAAGRKDRPVHVRERVRLDLFVRIADTLIR